mmetsp:Transcript_34856/g.75258  ORF Transcript_34856/g.75258 Transcript_34856/m.75258 type:complete len:276 (-) Transcript_34856:107-934(-)
MAKKSKSGRRRKGTSTEVTETSSVYDSIISTCCCGGSSRGENSIIKESENQPQQQGQQQKTQEREVNQGFTETPSNVWERLSDVALYLVGATPPVKFVRCLECTSVDGSELTLPRVLSELADDYDSKNEKWHMKSVWTISDNVTNRTLPGPGDNAHHPGTQQRRRSRSRSRSRNKRLPKVKSMDCYDNKSVFTDKTYLSTRSLNENRSTSGDATKGTENGSRKIGDSSGSTTAGTKKGRSGMKIRRGWSPRRLSSGKSTSGRSIRSIRPFTRIEI